MSTYREIVGKKIKKVTSDPSAGLDGEMWYNSTTGTLRGLAISEAWKSASSGIWQKNTAGGAGTTTAAVVYGGASASGTVYHNETAEYDGTNFSASGNLGTARQDGGSCGIQTAALFVGGEAAPGNSALVEEYNGSTWSEETNIPTSDRGWGSFGLQGAGVMVGGATAPTSKCQEYDGSNWTAGGSLNDGRRLSGMGCGTLTAGLVAGGDPNSNKTETYNGTAWATGNTLNTGRQQGKMSGPQTLGLVWGGETPSLTTATEKFDGTSWTTSSATLATAVKNNAGNKDNTSGTSALNVYGNIPGDTYHAEEYNSTTTVYTPAAYSALPNTPNSRNAEGAGSKNGSTTAAMNWCGGQPGPTGFTNTSVEWNGSAWSATPNYPQTARHVGGTGVEPAALGVAGFDSEGSNIDTVNEFDGSSWTGGGGYPLAQYSVATAGTQTAAITSGGGSNTTTSNDYNGSSWTGNPAMSSGRSFAGNAGTQTALIAMGGSNQPAGECEEFNGSSWTSGGNLASGYVSESTSTGGTQTAGMMCGANKSPGGSAGSAGYLQTYDGTSWITGASLGTARNGASVSGTTTAHMIATGYGPSTYSNSAEEFTPASSATNIKNFATT